MLTKEMLAENPALKDLDEKQIKAITTLSKNDEDAVLGARIGEIYKDIDKDIEEITGEKKPGHVKTYKHLKQVLTEYKEEAATAGTAKELKKQVSDLEAERDELNKKLEESSGDEALKTKAKKLEKDLKLAKDELSTFKKTYEDEKTAFEEKLELQKKQASQTNIEREFDKVEANVKFIGTVPETIRKETLAGRRAALLSTLKTDEIDDGEGGTRTVFLGEDGKVLRNKANNLEPYTAGELYAEKITDLVDKGRSQKGGGSKPPSGGGSGNGDRTPSSADLSGARSRQEAMTMAKKYVIEVEGIPLTDRKHTERVSEVISEADLPADLPMKS